MKKAMFSQPMAGLSDAEIIATRDTAVKYLEENGYEVVNTLFTDDWYNSDQMQARGVVQIPVCFLAKSIESMSQCHAAYFAKGWEKARGCRIEHDVAVAYGLEVIYEGVSNSKTYMMKVVADGKQVTYEGWNAGFDGMELLGIMEYKKADIIRCMLKDVTPEVVMKRTVIVEDPVPHMPV